MHVPVCVCVCFGFDSCVYLMTKDTIERQQKADQCTRFVDSVVKKSRRQNVCRCAHTHSHTHTRPHTHSNIHIDRSVNWEFNLQYTCAFIYKHVLISLHSFQDIYIKPTREMAKKWENKNKHYNQPWNGNTFTIHTYYVHMFVPGLTMTKSWGNLFFLQVWSHFSMPSKSIEREKGGSIVR